MAQERELILLIDDDPELCELVKLIFAREEFRVIFANDGVSGRQRLAEDEPDLVLLDLNLPDMDGWEIIHTIRSNPDFNHIPVIILSGLSSEEHVIRSLESGASDFICKPFSPRILLARIKAHLQRRHPRPVPTKPKVYQNGYLKINLADRRVTAAEERVHLTPTEFKLCAHLVRNTGQICTYAEIIEQVWGTGGKHTPAHVHVYIARLRQKLEPNPKKPIYILNAYGLGYRFT